MGKSQLELILQVYDGAIKAYRSAADRFRAQDKAGGRQELERGRRFLVHLYTTLDPEKGGEIAANLSKLYTHAICQTMSAEATGDAATVDEIMTVLNNLRAGWEGLSHNSAGNRLENEPEALESSQAPVGGLSVSA
jgi:flagellar protein FliS